MAKKEFRMKTQIIKSLYKSRRGRRSYGVREQVTEAKEGPVELRRKKGKGSSKG